MLPRLSAETHRNNLSSNRRLPIVRHPPSSILPNPNFCTLCVWAAFSPVPSQLCFLSSLNNLAELRGYCTLSASHCRLVLSGWIMRIVIIDHYLLPLINKQGVWRPFSLSKFYTICYPHQCQNAASIPHFPVSFRHNAQTHTANYICRGPPAYGGIARLRNYNRVTDDFTPWCRLHGGFVLSFPCHAGSDSEDMSVTATHLFFCASVFNQHHSFLRQNISLSWFDGVLLFLSVLQTTLATDEFGRIIAQEFRCKSSGTLTSIFFVVNIGILALLFFLCYKSHAVTVFFEKGMATL